MVGMGVEMKTKEALKVLGVSRPTLLKYVKQGLIKIDATVNGQHFYNEDSVYKVIGKEKPENS